MIAPIYTHRATGEQRRPVPGGASAAALDADPDWTSSPPAWAGGDEPVDTPHDDDPQRLDGATTPPEESP